MEFFHIKGYNTEKSSALYPTALQVFFHCIPQWKRFSSVVRYNGRSFILLRDTMEEVFTSIVGYNGRSFFPLWDKMEKNYTMQCDIFKF
jgi:hypothetical protein